MPLPSGARVGPYEIVSPLGAGGMGEVYWARNTKLGREVLFEGGFVPFDLSTPRTYEVASDGRFLTIQETQRLRLGSIVVIQNGFEELKRVAPAQ